MLTGILDECKNILDFPCCYLFISLVLSTNRLKVSAKLCQNNVWCAAMSVKGKPNNNKILLGKKIAHLISNKND